MQNMYFALNKSISKCSYKSHLCYSYTMVRRRRQLSVRSETSTIKLVFNLKVYLIVILP